MSPYQYGANNPVNNIDAVSYTHLDVYKRQTYDHADRISKVRNSLGGTSINLYDATYDNFGRLLTKQYRCV